MQQWRTPAKLIEEIKREDPNTCLTLYSIRQMLLNKEIQFIKRGRKYLVDKDSLLEYLSTSANENKITNHKLLPELVVKRGEVQMLKILHESSVVDNIYSLIKNLKDIQQTLEGLEVLPADIDDQIQIQNIRIKNAVGKINDLISNL